MLILERTGLSAEQVPLFVRLARQHRQDMAVDPRRERVLARMGAGPAPGLALGICVWWPDEPGRPRKYSYDDTLSTPKLKVTSERVIAYRLLDFGDMLVFGGIEGLRGRPTSGLLDCCSDSSARDTSWRAGW